VACPLSREFRNFDIPRLNVDQECSELFLQSFFVISPRHLLEGVSVSQSSTNRPSAPIAQTSVEPQTSMKPSIESITTRIDHELSLPSTSFLPRFRFEDISPRAFETFLTTTTYKSLCKRYPRARFNYNAHTQVFILQCMTTPIHDAPLPFLASAVYADPTLQPLRHLLDISSGTDFVAFRGRYTESRKQPDVLFRVDPFYWPTLVVEIGWFEEYDDLKEDALLWLFGG
jgi:hypothetical protein